MADLYEVLGVDRDASPEAIKAAGRKAAKETHPDKPGGNEEKFKLVSRALTILRDPEKRARYDQTGDDDATAPPADPVTPLVLRAFEVAMGQLAIEDPRYFDLAEAMKASLLGDASSGEAANVMIGETLDKLRIVQKRLRFKGEGEGPLARVIADRIKLNERNIADNLEKVGWMKAAAEFVGEFLEYQADERPVAPRWSDQRIDPDLLFRSIMSDPHGRRGRPSSYGAFHEFGTIPFRKPPEGPVEE